MNSITEVLSEEKMLVLENEAKKVEIKTYSKPYLAGSISVISSLGLIGVAIYGIYIVLIKYAHISGNYAIVGAGSIGELGQKYQSVLAIYGLETIIALFCIFLAVLGFSLAGGIDRTNSWLLLISYSLLSFMTFVLIVMTPMIFFNSGFPKLFFCSLLIFLVFPILISVMATSAKKMPSWKSKVPLIIPVAAFSIVLLANFALDSANANYYYNFYAMSEDFYAYFVIISLGWVGLNVVTLTEAFKNK